MESIQKAASIQDMHAIAARFAAQAAPGDVFCLSGDLGAGKTTFVQGFVEALGGDRGQVHSPTFSLIHEYEARLPVVHMDAYRIESNQEAVQAGMEAYLSEGTSAILLIEWPERIQRLLPTGVIRLAFSVQADGSRRIERIQG